MNPIGAEALREALHRVMPSGTDLLFVHTSLSACGRFTAGPDDVLSALAEFCGTLALPTHTYSYPAAPDEHGPVFDAAVTPSQNGRLTELFRTAPGVLRSIHATHSLAAKGPLAGAITAGHYRFATPCGWGTPYSRLVERHASVLMFGVTFHSYTLFHTAEDASGSAFAYEHGIVDRLRVIDETGAERECLSRRQMRNPRRFREAGELMERVGLVHRAQLGRGALLLVRDCAAAHDFLLERLKETPDFLYQSCTRTLQ